ncbi:MAG: molybdenum cofactor guanylyltransferase [Dehalococcoidales bacterium]|jgi:molybdopterin-guanine dinucleotide biosynthesis protein A|nr:molybdenum cofactor guanylyltransferase [Dehalococcoidales bacterium]MDD3994765.1 molybdenum cofactor guanylyltransferase [Dehalococcoidales bacterium]NLT27751.1 molybdenum cofactor guanylyltransferase [Dehalococcoidales bacterium]
MSDPVSAILLAGGKSSRLGTDKAKVKLDGESVMIQAIAEKLSGLSEDIVVSTNGRRYEDITIPVRWAIDVRPGAGSLMGLYSGLLAAKHDYAIAVACDMPFINIELLKYMISLPRDYDALLPKIGEQTEQLHSIYSKNCLPKMEKYLNSGHLKITSFMDEIDVKYVDEDIINKYDPRHLSFFNVNTAQQLNEAQDILKNKQ